MGVSHVISSAFFDTAWFNLLGWYSHKYSQTRFVFLLVVPTMNPVPSPPNTIGALSRTNSALSFSSTSEDDASLHTSQTNANQVTVMNSTRRTRKRFTNVQLTMLENLFHQNSH